MDRFDINILGCGSATPTHRHLPSSQIVNFREKLFMVDCGEGAQLQMRRMGLKFSRLGHIFLSHMHGDHVFGLPGLLSTLDLHDKGGRVVVHCFAEGRKVLRPVLDYFCRETGFEIVFEDIDPRGSGVLYEDQSLTVSHFPLYHRVPCTGFIFREKPRERKYLSDIGRFHGVPVYEISRIKAGADFERPDGRVVPNSELTTAPEPPMSYAYCSDTMPDERVSRAIEGVDVVYHESTYDSSLEKMAHARGHSTAADAARIARQAGAKVLVLGHYSKRYTDERLLLDVAREVFGPAVIAATEGMCLSLPELVKKYGND